MLLISLDSSVLQRNLREKLIGLMDAHNIPYPTATFFSAAHGTFFKIY